ncbi:hypothetical protein A0H81_03056 [Grifola frondosa]|uniref:MYND-type domain-containing protein n=1 Tax=Grifola frondosa TaxID=5627 RepID=A0A1C7MKG3_GRIFR|nr:hypothetical protein A0H81_03056 [Grifola frondosa]
MRPKLSFTTTPLTSWPSLRPGEVSSTARPVLQAIMRGNLQEVMLNMQLRAQGGELNLFKDPFMDLRQTVMSIAKAWDDGQRWCIMQDPAGENSAINLRFLSVYELDADTPVIVVLYQSVTKEKPLPGLRWIEAQKAKMGVKVLAMNAKRLSSEFKPKKDTSELGFKASFLLPIGPLGFEDLGSLNRDTGCVLCGKKTKNRCSACESASYCGQECQKADWQDHKQTCRSLKGGRWCTIPVAPTIPGAEGMYSVTANRFSTRSGVGSRVHKADDNTPYPNIHGERPFIIKIQIGLAQCDWTPGTNSTIKNAAFDTLAFYLDLIILFTDLKLRYNGIYPVCSIYPFE